MTLLDDWLVYVDKPDRFDQDHFASLMLELGTPALLHRALDPLPNGAEVAELITGFRKRADFNGTYLLPPIHDSDLSLAWQLAEKYRDGVTDRLRELDDPEAALVGDSLIVEIGYEDYRRLKQARELRLLNATMTISDDFVDFKAKFPEWIDGLYEALYMMTTFPEITRYLLWPMLRYPLDDTPAAEIWLMGHRIDFCEDRTLLIVGGAG